MVPRTEKEQLLPLGLATSSAKVSKVEFWSDANLELIIISGCTFRSLCLIHRIRKWFDWEGTLDHLLQASDMGWAKPGCSKLHPTWS